MEVLTEESYKNGRFMWQGTCSQCGAPALHTGKKVFKDFRLPRPNATNSILLGGCPRCGGDQRFMDGIPNCIQCGHEDYSVDLAGTDSFTTIGSATIGNESARIFHGNHAPGRR